MNVFTNSALAGSSGQSSGGGYQIERSLRFNSADSAKLTRTPSTAGNRKTWTWSGWVKRSGSGSNLGARSFIFSNLNSAGVIGLLCEFLSGNAIRVLDYNNATQSQKTTTRLFRDTTAWYHLVIAYDSTNATAGDRLRLYVNGVRETNFSSSTDPTLNADSMLNTTALTAVGWGGASTHASNGYMAEIHFIDGQALAASDFGEYDDNNVWQPEEYSGSYGTNGYYLDFSDNSSAAALGTDSSGNDNDFTVTNLSVTAGADNDSLRDSPTNGTQTDTGVGGEVVGNYATLNPLHAGHSTLTNGNLDSSGSGDLPTIIPGSGQWYYEINGTGYNWDGTAANFTSAAGSYNFGQRAFSGTPNSGHKALCTANLPEPTIADGSTAFDTVLDTGADILSTAQAAIGGSADLLWIKDRANTNNHQVIDTVRGGTLSLQSNTSAAETTYAAPSGNSVAWTWDAGSSNTTVAADGISSGVPSIASEYRANPSAGFSIVSYTGNATAGTRTIAHGLNAAPEMIIVKAKGAAQNGAVYHSGLDATAPQNKFLRLFSTGSDAAVGDYNGWGNTAPAADVFSVTEHTRVGAANDYIAYCFAPVESYSSFGSYTGNGNADGPFVYLGFRPAFVMFKCTDNTQTNWTILDNTRDELNPMNEWLYFNTTAKSYSPSTQVSDFTSNGFKLRHTQIYFNATGKNYIYAAFAEHPFKTARAR